jgi:hypothetical protein
VGWSGGINPRHIRRIIAAAIGVGCQKSGRGRLLEEKVKKKEEGIVLYLCNNGILRD